MKLTLKTDKAQSNIIIETNIFSQIPSLLKSAALKVSKYVIVTDSSVKTLLGDKLLKAMKSASLDTMMIVFKAGEDSKNRQTKAFVEDEMLKAKCGRDTMIIALGGGVVGDLAGFVAATYMRGIPYVQVPTTIIAQVDSSIGGKTAIDTPYGKNMIGAFHHPAFVFVDVATLMSLDQRNYIAGMAEVIKHAMILDKKLFDFLKQNASVLKSRKGKDYLKILEKVITRNLEIKKYVVENDPEEKGMRKILNYGHTVGHAVEKLSGYKLLHGEAVAIGMVAEAYIANQLGILSPHDLVSQNNLLQSFGLPIIVPKSINPEKIVSLTLADKKARGKKPNLSLVEKIGKHQANYVTEIDEARLIKFMEILCQ